MQWRGESYLLCCSGHILISGRMAVPSNNKEAPRARGLAGDRRSFGEQTAARLCAGVAEAAKRLWDCTAKKQSIKFWAAMAASASLSWPEEAPVFKTPSKTS
jgi:hypothetical protein